MGTPFKLGWAGGVNLIVDPADIRDDQLASARNTWPTAEGLLGKREAVRCLGTIKFTTETQVGGVQLWEPDPITGFDLIVQAKSGTSVGEIGYNLLAAIQLGKTVPAVTALEYIDITPGQATTAGIPTVSLVNYYGRTIAVCGSEGFYQFTQDSATGKWVWYHVAFNWLINAAGGVPAAQSQAIPINPRCVGQYRGRLVFANFGPGMGNWLVMSDRPQTNPTYTDLLNVPPWAVVGNDVLAANGRHFEVQALSGQDILYVGEISLNAISGPLQSALLILTDRGGVIATGELSESNDPGTTYPTYLGDFQPAKVNFECGIVGPRAICRAPNGTFWAGPDEIWALYDGEPKPRAIGTNIRPALATCPPALQRFWQMGYSQGAVYLSLATQNSDDAFRQAVQHWRLDLRPTGDGENVARPGSPAEARWWGPQDYEALDLVAAGSLTEGGQTCTAILNKTYGVGRNTMLGLVMADPNGYGAGIGFLHLVSFNEVLGGRDVPYMELSSGLTWTAYDATNNPVYAVGDVVMPTALRRNGRLYVCTVGGQPGGTEPTWPTSNGGTVADNAVTWTEIVQNTLDLRTPSYTGGVNDGIQMEPDFKELAFGTHQRDKIFKRADINAYVNVKQQLWLECVLNGGNFKGYMGPCIIGDFTVGRYPAYNDLGLMTLDLSSVAQEFQSRQLRPSAQINRAKQDAVGMAVVRGTAIQPKLRDGTGFVIDDTNDYVVWVSFKASLPVAMGTSFQAQLTHGYYANVDALLAEITAAMGDGQVLTGFTASATPWSYDSAFANPYPYMSTMTFTFSARTSGYFVAFVVKTDPTEAITDGGAARYVNRCARLLAMLGYDTGPAYTSGITTLCGLTPQFDGSDVYLVGEQTTPGLTSPTRICATQSIPFLRPAVVQVGEIEGEVRVVPGRPMGLSARQS